MTSKMMLAVALCAALAGACKKKAADAPATGSGSGTASGSAPAAVDAAAPVAIDAAPAPVELDAAQAAAPTGTATAEMQALEGTLKQLAAMADDKARAKAMCKALPTIRGQLKALADHPGPGAKAEDWRMLSESIGGGLDDFEMDCADDPSMTKPLAEMLESYPSYFELMAGKPL